MALPNQGKKRSTTQKTSARSKRHKSDTTSSTSTPADKKSTKSRSKVTFHENLSSEGARVTAFGNEKGNQESREKKERKGKGPRFIPAVLQDKNSEEEDEEDQDQQGAMDLDEDLDQVAANFLITLDEKGIAV